MQSLYGKLFSVFVIWEPFGGQKVRGNGSIAKEHIENNGEVVVLSRPMTQPETHTSPGADALEQAADQAIAACGGNARDAVKALLIANDFLEKQLAELQAAVSNGFTRGKIELPPRNRRMDWYD